MRETVDADVLWQRAPVALTALRRRRRPMKLWLSHPALGDFQLTEAPGVRAHRLPRRPTPAARTSTGARTNSDGEGERHTA